MTAHPRHPQRLTATEVNRVVLFTARDAIVASPDTLTLLKRQVNEYDLLEVSDHSAWEDAVALVNEDWRHMFHPSRFDRLRFRYMVYGWQKSVLLTITENLEDSLFSPTSLGVVGAWFDVAGATDAGAGLAFTLPNLLSANNATTSTDTRKPVIGTAANGVPILTCSTSCLRIPLHAAINGATQWWISMHMRITSAAGNPCPFSIDNLDGEASTRKLTAQRFVGDNLNVHDAASPTTLARRYGPATLWPLNTWVHCIWELNLATGGAENTRAIVCADGLPVVATFANAVGAPGAIPTAMAVPTGNMLIGAQRHAAAPNPWVGQIGRHILIGSSAMPGVTSGCLTPAARLALSNFDRPA